MGDAVIYYFSGTGNTLMLASGLATRLNGMLIPITSMVGQEKIRPESDAVGIVYPVYYNNLPIVVRKFAERLDGLTGKYLFAVANFGGASGVSLPALERIIARKGGRLAATYGLHMPQNAFAKPWENNLKLIKSAEAKLDRIAQNTRAREVGIAFSNPLERVMIRLHPKLAPLFKKGIAEKSGRPLESDMDEHVRYIDNTYHTNGNCTGCGLCSLICPVGNIEMRGGRPAWLHRCEACLACYNWCPVHAIEGDIAKKNYFYRNPLVRAEDIMNQRHEPIG